MALFDPIRFFNSLTDGTKVTEVLTSAKEEIKRMAFPTHSHYLASELFLSASQTDRLSVRAETHLLELAAVIITDDARKHCHADASRGKQNIAEYLHKTVGHNAEAIIAINRLCATPRWKKWQQKHYQNCKPLFPEITEEDWFL